MTFGVTFICMVSQHLPFWLMNVREAQQEPKDNFNILNGCNHHPIIPVSVQLKNMSSLCFIHTETK
jgi:hypothetical protein